MAKRAVKVTEEPKGYNGWTNYETWAVNLWIENEENTYRYWRERVKEACEAGGLFLDEPEWPGAKREVQVKLASMIKDSFTDAAPDLGATLWSDLLSAALSEVNWYEIAEHLLEE